MVFEEEDNIDETDKRDYIIRAEIDTIDLPKNNKAHGFDEIPAELLKYTDVNIRNELYNICNEIYLKGKTISDFEKGIVVLIPKNKETQKCEVYRTLNLTTHASKVIINIMKNKINKTIDEDLGKGQFGFSRNIGAKEVILTLRVLIEKQIKSSKDTFIAFVDLKKTFDNVKWSKLFSVLKTIGIKYKHRYDI